MPIDKNKISGPIWEGTPSIKPPSRNPARVQPLKVTTSSTASTSASSLPFAKRKQARAAAPAADVAEADRGRTTSPWAARATGRPTGLPKPSTTFSSQPNLSHHNIPAVTPLEGSVTTTIEATPPVKPQRNVLRRKQSTISQHTAMTRAKSQLTSSTSSRDQQSQHPALRNAPPLPKGYTDPFPGSILGFTLPPPSSSTASHGINDIHSKGVDLSGDKVPAVRPGMPHNLATQDLPLSNGFSAPSTSSASTRYSESPGPFSRTSTPTSISSYSPGVSASSKFSAKGRQTSPTRSRPPVARRPGTSSGDEPVVPLDATGLPALRESVTSSSSGSTAKPVERTESSIVEPRLKNKKQASAPPPSPPLRKSSMKFSRARAATVDRASEPPVPGKDQTSQLPTASKRPPVKAGTSGTEPIVPTLKRPFVPRRPSRAGAPDLEKAPPPPVVQSNLSQLPMAHGHQRRGSASRLPSRNPSPSPTQAYSRPPTPLQPQRTGDSQDGSADREDRIPPPRGTSPASISTGKSHSRFGLFSRRPKTPAEPVAPPPPREKLKKKGPAAGTGHEGYGKYAFRGRSGSSTSAGSSFARSTSASSTSGSTGRGESSRKSSIASKTEAQSDGFFADRLEPKVIIGGGAMPAEPPKLPPLAPPPLIRSESDQSFVGGRRPSVDSNHSGSTQFSFSNYSQSSFGGGDATNAATAEANTGRPAPFALDSSSSTLASDSRNNSSRSLPTLAARRSQHRSQNLTELGTLRIPPPMDLGSYPPSPSIASHDTSLGSMVPPSNASTLQHEDFSEGKEGNWLRPRKPEKRSRSPRKWNIFQKTVGPPKEPTNITELSTTVAWKAPSRPQAHYALLESTETFGHITRDASVDEIRLEGEKDDEEVVDLTEAADGQPTGRTQQHVHSTLLPSPPAFPANFASSRPASPKVSLQPLQSASPPKAVQAAPPAKRSRLAQVGRIPKVVSTRDRQSSRQSILQAFIPHRPTRASATAFTFDGGQSDIHPSQRSSRSSGKSGSKDAIEPHATPGLAITTFPADEFISFPSKLEPCLSSSSSSNATASLTAITAIIPVLGSDPMEDEVWDEYDDLINDQQDPCQLATPPWAKKSKRRRHRRRGELHAVTPSTGKIRRVSSTTLPRVFESKPRRKRSEKKLAVPEPSPGMPETPSSFTSLFAGYEERNLSMILTTTDSSSGLGTLTTKTSCLDSSSRHSTCDSTIDDSVQEDIDLGEETDVDDDQMLDSDIDLRFGALMTSKWLSFGRVLFSPAHGEMSRGGVLPGQERVLILDGLCNDDWSYYCALTYPNAVVYNLSPSPPSATKQQQGPSAWASPSNHRQIHHPSLSNPFPFPKGFFSAVVLRFPLASSETGYRGAISECKRVLRPGGHLEISVLDLDLMNMGTRTRRAVRDLKVRMQAADETVSLKPMSDLIIRLLGRRGFENVNRCTLGVPAAGDLRGSPQGSIDKTGLSLSEMLRDRSGRGDEGITKMVARVGRWWYGRCHEDRVLTPDEDEDDEDHDETRSIWDDRAVLRECERKKTSFKLLICYAQKPLVTRRRTVSV